MVSETGVKLVMSIFVFWAVFLGLVWTYSSQITYSSNADLSELDASGNNWTALFNIMTFQIDGSFPIFVGLILDLITIFTALGAFVVLIK